MTTDQTAQLERMTKLHELTSEATWNYWFSYSHAGTWQFWVDIALLVAPLLALFLYIDRGKAFLLGFYGFGVHMLFTCIDAYGVTHGLWIYPYKAIPFLSVNLPLDIALIPVLYMFVYQWDDQLRQKLLYLRYGAVSVPLVPVQTGDSRLRPLPLQSWNRLPSSARRLSHDPLPVTLDYESVPVRRADLQAGSSRRRSGPPAASSL
ncbi:hypothetical protein J2T17_002190 [Paenibacillus mucilaginosus]|uniref:CBO0543 family protein n=1 Tax=Paenibacillus mucilaginosus TaxID=61624 RepID=UPI003D232FC7